MNRNYTREEYINLIDKLITAQPKLKFSSDFIIGYPGESEQDFQDTLNLIKRVNFINSYSLFIVKGLAHHQLIMKIYQSVLQKKD